MKLALGTVQFGLNYGITNVKGKVSVAEVEKILALAKNIGITTLDTAAAYGESESVLGELNAGNNFTIVTKIPELSTQSLSIADIVDNSLTRLGCKKIDALLFHHADDLTSSQAHEYYHQAAQLKEQGVINKLGISVYQPEQVVNICQRFNIDIVQLPMNWLDQRFVKNEIKNVLLTTEVHVRSLFLQGILLADIEDLPAYFLPFKEKINSFHQYCHALHCQPLTLALALIHQQQFIDKAVIGCCSVTQLEQIAEHYLLAQQLINQNTEKMQHIGQKLASNNEALITPSLWNIDS
ncbi:aldo/keto reductase [Colwelliaceae bacterium 6441]